MVSVTIALPTWVIWIFFVLLVADVILSIFNLYYRIRLEKCKK
jgi:hypothetical protein